jgi:hypothetical protein
MLAPRPTADVLRYLRPTGLEMPEGIDYDTWAAWGALLGRLGAALPWAVGDWLVWGEDRFPDRYSQAMEVTGLQVETLANYAWVCRAWPRSRRREAVAFGLHADLAALEETEQETWMEQVEREGWTRAELRRRLGRVRQAVPDCPPHRCRCGVTWSEG